MADLVDGLRTAVTDRAELPGMSLMEHLAELRKRLIHSVVYLLVGVVVAYIFHERLYGYHSEAPRRPPHPVNITHPTDALNLYLKTAFLGGAILASPFILYQIWLFISPGMYQHEKRYVVPFMAATVGLFSRRSLLRLPLGSPRRARRPHSRLRQALPPHPHHR